MRTHIQQYSKTAGEISLYIYTDAALSPLRPYYMCVLKLLPYNAIQVYTYIQTPLSLLCGLTILLYMCPHKGERAASVYMYKDISHAVLPYCYVCVLILLYMCPHTAICVLILLCRCPHTAIYVSSQRRESDVCISLYTYMYKYTKYMYIYVCNYV